MLRRAACNGRGAGLPPKPIKMVVGFPPGGSNDQVARIIAPRWRRRWASRW